MKFNLVATLCIIWAVLNVDFVSSQYSETDTSGCSFPFKYKGKSYDKCIKAEGIKYEWCSLTPEYQGVWKYCQDQTKTTWECDEGSECTTTKTNKVPHCKTSYESTSRTGRKYTKKSTRYCLDQLTLTDQKEGDCSPAYKNISEFHTACLPPNPNLLMGADSTISDVEKQEILDLHNGFRTDLKVPAAAMLKIYWDKDLAYTAQKHAERCSFSHDKSNMRQIPGTGKYTGQNIVMQTNGIVSTFADQFKKMYDGEKKRWNYGTGISRRFKGKFAYHYTQILLEHVNKIGCGKATCVYPDRVEKLYVCNLNYIQKISESKKPYQKGEWCSKCPDNCDGKLCDCKDKECFNGGKLDPSTCECACEGFFEGADCATPMEFTWKGQCIFPFMFNGKVYKECTPEPNSFCSKKKYYEAGQEEWCDTNGDDDYDDYYYY